MFLILLAAIVNAAPAAVPCPISVHVHSGATRAFSLLDPGFAARKADSEAAGSIVARARKALTRPPGAIARLHTEGTLPGQGIRDISLIAKRDQSIVLDLAIAWRLTGDRANLDQASRYLDRWVAVYQMSFNPIDETGFDTMMMASDLIEADLPDELQTRIDAFWRRMAIGYLDAMDGTPGHAVTNWQSHRVKLATLAAFRTGDRRLINRARDAYRKQIAANLRPDGSTFDYEERDALHYVTYDLDPLMMAALAAKVHGEDWYDWSAPDGASLPRSLAWLADFARGDRTHVEFAKSKIQFDRDRAAAGDGEYAPHLWQPGNALPTFQIASLLDPRFRDLANALALANPRGAATWINLY